MEPNRFDQEIKNKLDKRVIAPSVDAWDTLSKCLDVQVEKRNNRSYWWLGLAASMVGFLFVVNQFRDKEQNVVDSPKVVVTPNDDLNVESVKSEKQYNITEQAAGIEQTEISDEYEAKGKSNFKEDLSLRNSDRVVAETSKGKTIGLAEEKPISGIAVSEEELTFEEQKIQDVVAQVQALKDENVVVSEADLNALLISAQKEITLNKLDQEVEGKVDAYALLESVEQELDQSFRSKVLEAIRTSYNSVKTAIATRNE